MSPITADLEELGGEGADTSDALFQGNTDELIFNPPAVPFEPELPAAVAQEPEETALDIYLREKAERDATEQARALQVETKAAALKEYLANPDVQTIAPLDQETGFGPIAVELIEKQKAENYEKDFGWLGGEKMPGWAKYKESNRVLNERWEELTAEQKVKAFDHYTNQAAKYYTQYNKVSPEKFGEAINNVLIRNHDLIDDNVKLEEDRLEAAGHGRGWKDSVIRGADIATLGLLPARDNPGYESMSAGLTASNAYKQANQLLEDLRKIQENGGEIFNPDGTVNLEEYNKAVQAIKEDIPSEGEGTLGQELAVQTHEDLLRSISNLGPDPEGRIRGLLGAAKGYSRIGQLQMTKMSPELQEGLSGHRLLPNPLGQQEDKLSDTERIKRILSKPGEFIGFTAGMVLAQQADLLEETLTSGGVVALTGLPALGLAGNAYAAGQQEAALVASDLIQEGLRKKGYDPFSITDWERAYDSGVVKELVKEAEATGQLKGLTTAGVESIMENAFLVGLKRVPFFGAAASGLKRLPQLAAKGLSHGTAGFTSAASGELAGQLAAYPEVDLAEVFTEGVADVAGTGAISAYKKGVTSIYGRATGQRPATAGSPTQATVSTEEQSVDSEESEVRSSLQPPAPPEGDQGDAQEISPEVSAGTGDVAASGGPGVAPSASESAAAILAARGFTKDAYESYQAMVDANPELAADVSAQTFIESERLKQSPEGARLLAEDLKALEEVGMLSPEEVSQYGVEAPTDLAINREIFESLQRRIAIEESIRQSPQGMEGLRQQLQQAAAVTEPIPTVESDAAIQQKIVEKPEIIGDMIALAKQVDEQIEVAISPKDITVKRAKDFTTSGNYDVVFPTGERLQIFRDPESRIWYNTERRPDGSYEMLSTSTRKEAEETLRKNYEEGKYTKKSDQPRSSILDDLKTELQAANDALEDAEKAFADSLITEDDLQAYRDSKAEAEQAVKNFSVKRRKRKNQQGFLNVGLAINGLHEAAITAWSKAKDFASWSADLVKQFGDKVKPVLRDLWNRITALLRKTYEIVVDPVLPGRNTEIGGFGIPGNQQILSQIDQAIKDKKEWNIDVGRDSTYGAKKLRFSVAPHPNTSIDRPVFSVTALGDQYGVRDFNSNINKSFNTKEQFIAAIQRYRRAEARNTQRGMVDLRGFARRKIEGFGGRATALAPVAESINYKYLDKEHRADLAEKLTRLEGDYKDVKKTGIDPSKSKELYDRVLQVLKEAKENSYQREFNALKELYPASLGGKQPTDFQSGKEIRAYVATQGAAPDQAKIAAAAAGSRAGRKLAAENKDKQLKESAALAKTKLVQVLDTPEYKALPDDIRRQILKAVKYLSSQDPDNNSTAQNEALIAGVNNLSEGDYTGMGRLASLQRVREFTADLQTLVKSHGGRLPFFDQNVVQKGLEAAITGQNTGKLFKKEAIIRAVGFSHPELKKLWNKHFGNYLEKVQTENSQLQQALTDELHEISKKHNLAKKKLLGKIRGGDKDYFNSRVTESMRRMNVAAMLTTWRESAVDPADDINGIINDLYTSTQTEKDAAFYGAQGEANEAALMKFIKPALEDGMLIQSELGFELNSTPDVWNEYILGKLNDNERAALNEFREVASRFQAPLKFISEFYYGKEFDPWVHYLPRVVYGKNPVAPTDAPELTSTASRALPEGTPLPTHGSVLHPRQRLGKDQFYGMDLHNTLQNSLNTAAYEATTAESRFAIEAALKSDVILPFFGDNKVRRERFKSTLRQIHQAELHQGTGLKQPSNAPAAFVNDAFNTVSNVVLSVMLARIRQYPSQFITPFLGAFTMVGPRMPQYMSQWINGWSKEQANKLYAEAFPDLKQRVEQIDPFFDRAVSRSVLDRIADISLNTEGADLTDQQKRLVYLARIAKATRAALEGSPKFLARTFTNRADYHAVQAIFPIIFQDQLIKEGLITKPDEFTPENVEELRNNPKYSEVIANTKTAVSDIMGNANRFSLRPDVFVFRGEQNPIIRAIFGLMQTVTQYAGDRFVDFKDQSYFNKSDPYAGRIRTDARKRMASAMLQSIAFSAISGLVGYVTLSALAGIGTKAEGLDEEEQKVLDKLTQLRKELMDETMRDRAVRELAQMIGGPFATNSIVGTGIDMAHAKVLLSFLKDDITEKKNELREQIKKTKNESAKADLQIELDALIKRERLLTLSENRDGFSLGPVVSEILRAVQDKGIPSGEADTIAQEYWKKGGLKKKPDPNILARWAGKFGSFLSGDIRDAQRQIDRARTLVARSRREQLEEQARNKKPRVDKININALR